VWSDGDNFARGHWLNGRLSAVSLAYLIKAIAARHGLTSVDVFEVAGLVDGFVLDRPMSGRDAMEAVLSAFALDAIESDGVLKFRSRASRVSLSVAKQELVETGGDRTVMVETRAQETDLPRAVRLAYVESALDYRTAAVQQMRNDTASSRDVSIQVPAAMSQSLAQARADTMLSERWSQRCTAQFALPPRLLNVEAGDVLSVDGKDYRISQITDAEARQCEAVQHDASVYSVPSLVERVPVAKLLTVFGTPDVVFMDVALSTSDTATGPWIAAQANPWPGRLAVLKKKGVSFAFNGLVGAQATMGETLTSLPSGLLGRVDYRWSLDVRLDFGALSSVSLEDVLDGANVALVGSDSAGYELVQFERAELIAAQTYRLSGLLRAQGGSVGEMLALRGAGQRFVVLNGAVTQAAGTLQEATTASRWRVGPPQYDQAHPSYVTVDVAPTTRGLRPLPPVHMKMIKEAGGVRFSWTRQTRFGGDAWDVDEVPLAEASELYEVRVMNGANIARSWRSMEPHQFYGDALMIADFGAVPSQLTLRVAQVSAAVGTGIFSERTFDV
jgi:hypothetical protein